MQAQASEPLICTCACRRLSAAEASNVLRLGDVVMFDNRPCVVHDIRVSQPGKHGGWKIALQGKDIITDEPREFLVLHTSPVLFPIVTQTTNRLASCREVDGRAIISLHEYDKFIDKLVASPNDPPVRSLLDLGSKTDGNIYSFMINATILRVTFCDHSRVTVRNGVPCMDRPLNLQQMARLVDYSRGP